MPGLLDVNRLLVDNHQEGWMRLFFPKYPKYECPSVQEHRHG